MKKQPKRRLPSKQEILRVLKGEIDEYRLSYRESDGVIRDQDALHTIRCLEIARLCVKTHKFPAP